MNWWMIGCGAAIVANFYLLVHIGKEAKKKEELEEKNRYLEGALSIADPLLKCQNSMIDDLIKKIPDKKEVEES